MTNFQENDRVTFSKQWLQSTCSHTTLGLYRGTITKVEQFGYPPKQLATVKWDEEKRPQTILATNLVLVKRLHLEPA